MNDINLNKGTALLVMDVQGSIVKNLKDNTQFLSSIVNAIEKARANDIPIIFVVVGFRKNFPEVSANNKSFSTLKSGNMDLQSEEATSVHSSISLLPNDIVVVKKRVSAFAGSDLEIILRAFDIKHLVLSGISTSGVVLSTLRAAADKDYKLTVLADCCADNDEEVHRVLLSKVFTRQADITTSAGWLNG